MDAERLESYRCLDRLGAATFQVANRIVTQRRGSDPIVLWRPGIVSALAISEDGELTGRRYPARAGPALRPARGLR